MEDFGTLTIRLYVRLPGKHGRIKAVVLHRFHGQKDECMHKAAQFVKANPQLQGELAPTWEVRQALHVDDLPRVTDDSADD